MSLVLVDLLFYTGARGGRETYVRELYRQLGAMETGMEFVGFASTQAYALDNSWFPGTMINSGISGENRFHWAYGELFGVPRRAKKIGANLIHAPAMLGPYSSSMPTVFTLHDVVQWSRPDLVPKPFYTAVVRWMQLRASKNSAHILTDSEASARDIVRFLGFDPARLHVVPLAGTVSPGSAPERASTPDSVILATGNRYPHKNWGGLIRGLALIDESIRPRLVITGHHHGVDPLRSVVDELGMEKWVDLKSWVSPDELTQLYRSAAVMAMPSFFDGFSLPALEAMMVGLPVMISDIPVYREVVGDAALFFDPHDDASIAAAMIEAVTNPERMAQLSQAGYEQASRFSWEKVATETLSVFKAALGKKRRSRVGVDRVETPI